MTKSSTMRKARLPIIRSLSDYAYKVGEISFPPEWIPEGDYNSVVKEIKERMKDYKIQLVSIPSIDDDMLVYLPPLLLPSGFEATPFPVNVRKPRERGTDYYLNCGVEKSSNGIDHVYSFDGRGDYQGLCHGNKEEMIHYVKKLKELFESGSKSINGIDAIHLRKKIKELPINKLEESEELFRKYEFEGATFETASHYVSGQNRFIGQLKITNAYKQDKNRFCGGYKLYVLYNRSDDRFEGSPNLVSILLYSGITSPLTTGSLKFLEEFAQLF